MMTFHPAFENRRAVASPKPAVAPVTSTVLVMFSPIIRFFVFFVGLVRDRDEVRSAFLQPRSPPATGRIVPVMYEASSDARKRIGAACSSSVP